MHGVHIRTKDLNAGVAPAGRRRDDRAAGISRLRYPTPLDLGVAMKTHRSRPHQGAGRVHERIASAAQRLALLALVFSMVHLLAGCHGADRGAGDPVERWSAAASAQPTLVDPSWVPAAPMSVERTDHAATRLLDGMVLVAGGSSGSSSSPVALSSAALYNPASGAWIPAASMGSSRIQPAAVLLADGRVLVIGGEHQGLGLATAEIYDPATHAWTPTPPMASPRRVHAAVRLADGRVLVAGGRTKVSAFVTLSSAEIYDPATDTWTPAASMQSPRAYLTATLLESGEVLVASAGQSSAEVYDPASNTWWPTGPMVQGRGEHTATRLLDGRVLVAGGASAVTLSDAEIYDPATQGWTAAPGKIPCSTTYDPPYYTSVDGVVGQRAVLLPSGLVLVTGGYESMVYNACGSLSCIPEPSYHALIQRTEIYDPAAQSWTLGPPLGLGRGAHTATLLEDGRVLVAGGHASDQDNELYPTPSAEILMLGVPGAPCASADDCAGSACVDGVCCTAACDGPCEACAIAAGAAEDGVCAPISGPACDDGDLCTQADTCLAGACIGAPAADGAPCDDGSACTQDDACLAGACAGGSPVVCSAQEACHVAFCDPATGQCVDALAPGGSPCDDGEACTQVDACEAGACVGGSPVVCSTANTCAVAACDVATGACVETIQADGADCSDLDACTLPDTCQAGVCTSGPPKVCPVPSSCHVAGICFSPSGACGIPSTRPDGEPCPDPTTSAWAPAAPMDAGRANHTATVLQDGTVLVAGAANGSPSGFLYLSSASRYDPTSNTWSPAGAMAEARGMHTATLLPDGTVLVAGGRANPPTSGVERYHPVSNGWSAAASLSTPRREHTATLLSNGKILVTGGASATGSPTPVLGVESAEIYDPATDAWAPASPMSVGRWNHTATLLPDGRVLVVGGEPWGTRLAELYSPATDTWAPAGQPNVERSCHAATLLPDGRVLVVGGDENLLHTAEIYDPATHAWTYAASPHFGHQDYTAELLVDGQVLLMGNLDVSAHLGLELYDPAADTWTLAPPLSTGNDGQKAAQLPDGRVLITGGCLSHPCNVVDAWLYTPGVVLQGNGVCASGVCVDAEGPGTRGGGAGGASQTGSGGAGGNGGGGYGGAGGAGGSDSGYGGYGGASGSGSGYGGAGGSDGGSGGAGGSGGGSTSGGAGGTSSSTGPGGSSSSGVGASTSASGSGSAGQGGGPPGGDGGSSGCGVARLPATPHALHGLALAALLGMRRRRRRAAGGAK